MKDYMDAVKAAGIGRTPQLCQDALIEMLEELFAGKKYNGQQGRKPLNIYKQDLPVPEDYDADVDTDAAAAPYIVARMTGGAIKDESGPQRAERERAIRMWRTSKRTLYSGSVRGPISAVRSPS